MLLYTLYNSDLIDLPDNPEAEDSLGYVDDIAPIAFSINLIETTNCLQNIMTKARGGLDWSLKHNSRFEVSRSAIMHFSRKTVQDPDDAGQCIPISKPDLILEGQIVKQVYSYKYLGILIDCQLNWKEQAQRASANAIKWILQY